MTSEREARRQGPGTGINHHCFFKKQVRSNDPDHKTNPEFQVVAILSEIQYRGVGGRAPWALKLRIKYTQGWTATTS